MNEWQPIETAPTDGSWLVMASKYSRLLVVAVSYDAGSWLNYRGEEVDVTNMTHWTSLPPLPGITLVVQRECL